MSCVRRTGALAAGLALLAGCSSLGVPSGGRTQGTTRSGGVETGPAGFAVPHLEVRSSGGTAETTYNYCGGLDAADCAVLALVEPAVQQCPTARDATPADFSCSPLRGDEAILIGFRVVRQGETRRVSIHRGDARSGLSLRYEAVDERGSWSSVDVCAEDVSGDGRTDLVVEYRNAGLPGEVLVEVVDLAVTPAQPPLLVTERLAVPAGRQGRGCVVADRLDADFAQRSLDLLRG
jgi:hypothetical protein